MSKSDKYIAIEGCKDYCFLEQLNDGFGELKLLLSKKNSYDRLSIIFNNVLTYISTYETARSKIFYEDMQLSSRSVFFEVINSSYIQWLEEQSNGIYLHTSMKHYCVITTESVIDIVCEMLSDQLCYNFIRLP